MSTEYQRDRAAEAARDYEKHCDENGNFSCISWSSEHWFACLMIATIGGFLIFILVLVLTNDPHFNVGLTDEQEQAWSDNLIECNTRPTWKIGDKVVNYITKQQGKITNQRCGPEHKWEISYSQGTFLEDARNLQNITRKE